MAGSTIAVVVIPIVVALALLIWILVVFWANRHPEVSSHGEQIRTEVRGGAFQALEGGRQLMPIPEHRPAVPGQREAAAEETYRVPAGATASTAAPDAADVSADGPDAADVSPDQAETQPAPARPPA